MFFDCKVYVACSLTHAPVEFRANVELVKVELERICHVLHFVGLSDDTPRQTYNHDIGDCVANANLVFGICDYPAIGLGYELAAQCEARGKEVLATAHVDSLVSKLILDTGKPNFEFRRYRHMREDCVRMVAEKLQKMYEAERSQQMLFPELSRSRHVA